MQVNTVLRCKGQQRVQISVKSNSFICFQFFTYFASSQGFVVHPNALKMISFSDALVVDRKRL